MRYLRVPKFLNISTPALPFRRRTKFITSDQIPQGERGVNAAPPRQGPRMGARGFAVKFYDILSHESSAIITWTPSGKAFQVVDYTRFSEEILLKYFRHNKFSSFRRQLNLYGYRKVIKGPDAGAYMHPSFQRGRPDLLGEVKKGKVPHYDMHGVNEIHGQHFRHHPPGAKSDGTVNGELTPSHVTPLHNPTCSPVTPEMNGDTYAAIHASPNMPIPQSTPGTEAMHALSNMSLEEMNDTRAHGQGWVQPDPSMNALTLTPAWAGAGPSTADSGESLRERSMDRGKMGSGGDASGGSGLGMGVDNNGLGSGGMPNRMESGGSSNSGAPTAYWNKQRSRRTMSAQLVFPSHPPNNTEEIVQPDPNLADVMDVICQCMEVRSSTDESLSQLSQVSGCSFKMESTRRSSIFDLLNCMSWESALRTNHTPPQNGSRPSSAGTLESVIFDSVSVRNSGGSNRNSGGSNRNSGGSNRNSGGSNRNSAGSNRNSYGSTRNSAGSHRNSYGSTRNSVGSTRNSLGSTRNSNGRSRTPGVEISTNGMMNNLSMNNSLGPPTAPTLEQKPSFDPTGEVTGHVVPQRASSVISMSPLAMVHENHSEHGRHRAGERSEQGKGDDHLQSQSQPQPQPQPQPQQQGRPSFDPNRESTITSTIRAVGREAQIKSEESAAAIAAAAAAVEAAEAEPPQRVCPEVATTWFMNSAPGQRPEVIMRDSSRDRESTVARIFNAAPPRSSGQLWEAGGVGEGAREWDEGNGREGRDSAGSVSSTARTVASWDSSQASNLRQAANSAATVTAWGLPEQQQQQQQQQPCRGEGLGPQSMVSESPPASAVMDASPSQEGTSEGAEVFTRPSLERMGSLSWVKKPAPSRRPTIHESHEVNKVLSNQSNFAAWARVTDDSDSIMLAKNIGEFLG